MTGWVFVQCSKPTFHIKENRGTTLLCSATLCWQCLEHNRLEELCQHYRWKLTRTHVILVFHLVEKAGSALLGSLVPGPFLLSWAAKCVDEVVLTLYRFWGRDLFTQSTSLSQLPIPKSGKSFLNGPGNGAHGQMIAASSCSGYRQVPLRLWWGVIRSIR